METSWRHQQGQGDVTEMPWEYQYGDGDMVRTSVWTWGHRGDVRKDMGGGTRWVTACPKLAHHGIPSLFNLSFPRGRGLRAGGEKKKVGVPGGAQSLNPVLITS